MKESIFYQELSSAPELIKQQLHHNSALIEHLVPKLNSLNLKGVMLIGRGTSDHAGVFAKYFIETQCNLPVFASAPSVASVFDTTLKLDGFLVLSISQSGKSPDILLQTQKAKEGGAFTIALVNDESSELAQMCDEVLPLRAGKEKAVAASKSYLATLTAIIQLFASYSNDSELLLDLQELPTSMAKVLQSTPSLQAEHLKDIENCVVLGRGFGYAISREMALKLKEVLAVHAESFSSAEFMHGPVTLARKSLSVLGVFVDDETAKSHQALVEEVSSRGASVVDFSVETKVHKRLHPVLLMQKFYRDLALLAEALGVDPDSPEGLNKVTKTL